MSNPRVDDAAEYCRHRKGSQLPGDEVRNGGIERALDGAKRAAIFLIKKIS